MSAKIIERIAGELGVPDLPALLAERVAPSDLQSLLLHVFRAHAARLDPGDLLRQAERSALVPPSDIDARTHLSLTAAAFAAAGAFEAVELSPVAVLGANQVLGGIDQNNVLSAMRGVEVMADPTVALALESARRRRPAAKRRDAAPLRLCASQRLVRMQPFDGPGFSRHFRVFCLTTAGRDRGGERFEVAALAEQVGCHLALLRSLGERGYRFADVVVSIADTELVRALCARVGLDEEEARKERAHAPGSAAALFARRGLDLPALVEDPEPVLSALPQDLEAGRARARLLAMRAAVVAELAPAFPAAAFRFDLTRLQGARYYAGLCFDVSATDPTGVRLNLADGGFTDWTQRLLCDRKERLLISGIGTELIPRRFRA